MKHGKRRIEKDLINYLKGINKMNLIKYTILFIGMEAWVVVVCELLKTYAY